MKRNFVAALGLIVLILVSVTLLTVSETMAHSSDPARLGIHILNQRAGLKIDYTFTPAGTAAKQNNRPLVFPAYCSVAPQQQGQGQGLESSIVQCLSHTTIDIGIPLMPGQWAVVQTISSTRSDLRTIAQTNNPNYTTYTLALHEQNNQPAYFLSALRLGFLHLLQGADHLVMLLLFVWMAPSKRKLLGILTAFTAGHSLSLASTYLGWWTIVPKWSEVMIALTIVYSAADILSRLEKTRSSNNKPAIAIALFIGLLHGLGFGNQIAIYPAESWHVLLVLAGFNIGLELAQLLAVLFYYRLLNIWLLLTIKIPWVQQLPLLFCGVIGGYWTALQILA